MGWFGRPSLAAAAVAALVGCNGEFEPDILFISAVPGDTWSTSTLHAARLVGDGVEVKDLGRAESFLWSPDRDVIALSLFAGIHLVAPDGDSRQLVAAGTERIEWSPSSRWLAFGGASGVQIIRYDGHVRVLTGSGGGWQWSPDGAWIAFGENDAVSVAAVDGTAVARIRASTTGGIAFDPRSRYFAETLTGSVRVWSLETGEMISFPDLLGSAALEWSSDGGWLAHVSEPAGELAIVRPDGSAVVRVASSAAQPTWAPGRDVLAFVQDGALRLAGPDIDQLLAPPPVPVFSWSPAGDAIAFVSGTILYVSPADVGSTRFVAAADERGVLPSISWSADGSRMLLASARELVSLRPDGSDRRTIADGAFNLTGSPDGQWLAFSTRAADASELYDLHVARADGSELRRLMRTVDVAEVLWQGDGRHLFFVSDRVLHGVALDGGEPLRITPSGRLNREGQQAR